MWPDPMALDLSGITEGTEVTYSVRDEALLGQARFYGNFTFVAPHHDALQEQTVVAMLADQGTFMGFGSNVTLQMIHDFGDFENFL